MVERQQHAPRCVHILANILDSTGRLRGPALLESLNHQRCFDGACRDSQVLQARQRIQDIDLSEPALVINACFPDRHGSARSPTTSGWSVRSLPTLGVGRLATPR